MLGISISDRTQQLTRQRVRVAMLRAQAITRRLVPLAPVLVVAAWLILMALTYFVEQHYGTKRT